MDLDVLSFRGLVGIFAIVTSCVIVTALIYDTIPKCIKYKHSRNKKFGNTPLWISLTMYLILVTIQSTSLILRLWFAISDKACKSFGIIGGVSYGYSRMTLFTFFIIRLKISYSQTIFKVNKYHLYILITILITLSVASPMYYILGNAHGTADNELNVCITTYNTIWLSLVGLADIILSITSSLSFIIMITTIFITNSFKSP